MREWLKRVSKAHTNYKFDVFICVEWKLMGKLKSQKRKLGIDRS